MVRLLSACAPGDSSSHLLGHFENVIPSEQESLIASRPRAEAEYVETDTVLVSHEIAAVMFLPFRELEREILEAGANLVVAGPRDQQRPWVAHSAQSKRIVNSYDIRTKHIAVKSPPGSVWARDWAPVPATNRFGDRVLLDFNYLKERPDSDHIGQVLVQDNPNLKRLSIPLYLEGGNLTVNSQGYCIVSDRVLMDNRPQPEGMYLVDENGIIVSDEDGELLASDHVVGTPYLGKDGKWRVRTDEIFLNEFEIRQILRDYVGCREVYIVPSLPHEVTRHVDVIMKFVNDTTIIVGDMQPSRLELIKDPKLKQVSEAMANHLVTLQSVLDKAGFRVIRMPMPLPQIPTPSKPDEVIVRSYVNALLINAKGKKTAIVPRYLMGRLDREGHAGPKFYDYTDAAFQKSDEKIVRQIYETLGYRVRFIESDALIQDFGAIHCVTMQYPYRLSFP